jgi:hypothetical protein
MKFLYLFIVFGNVFGNCEKFIKNININSCRNCVNYLPYKNDFNSELSRCEKFGNKNIINDKINYDFAQFCRDDEEKCGQLGKYYKEEKNLKFKIYKDKLDSNIKSISLFFLYMSFVSFIFFIYDIKLCK